MEPENGMNSRRYYLILKEKHILDLGCGYGWHCKYAAEHKAKSVVGVDISEKMLKVAQEKNQDDKITYIHSAIEDLIPILNLMMPLLVLLPSTILRIMIV